MFMTFYNVDMEKAKNINDLLEEYERMEAIIDMVAIRDGSRHMCMDCTRQEGSGCS